MKTLIDKLDLLSQHLEALNNTFIEATNYTSQNDYNLYRTNYDKFESLVNNVEIKYSNIKISSNSGSEKIKLSFADEIYHQDDRQMKLADILEYLFFSRGIYYLFQSSQFKQDRIPIFLELILRFVNLLMLFECATVDKKLRDALLMNLEQLISEDIGFNELKNWPSNVGLPGQDSGSPDEYFDSILPKTAGGLWHEMLVYAFVLRYNIGYIFPLLLIQKPISLENKLSPPDLIILHNKTFRYYGIEIGNLKERQSGGFMAPSGLPIIPIDTLNARISDRCPSCKKWIGICDKVIEDFSSVHTPAYSDPENEIRCLLDCKKFTLEDKISGKCPYMKFRSSSKINGISYPYSDNKHHHYSCCVRTNSGIVDSIKQFPKFDSLQKYDELSHKNVLTIEDQEWINTNDSILRRTFNFLKTHSVYYSELTSLITINKTIISHDSE